MSYFGLRISDYGAGSVVDELPGRLWSDLDVRRLAQLMEAVQREREDLDKLAGKLELEKPPWGAMYAKYLRSDQPHEVGTGLIGADGLGLGDPVIGRFFDP